jgi:hypothetical protein
MNILERIGLITESILDFFSKIPKEIRGYAAKAILVVNEIKEAIDSDTADDITELIPGDWDDKLRDGASSLISGLMAILKGVKESGADEAAIRKAKGNLYLGLSSGIVGLMDGNELPGNRYDTYTQIAYSHQKKHKADKTS